MIFNPIDNVSPARDAVLAQRGLPPVAYIANDDKSEKAPPVIAVKRGETGYYPIFTRRSAAELNEANGVSPAQAQAMHMGSLFGWEVPGAFPSRWTDKVPR